MSKNKPLPSRTLRDDIRQHIEANPTSTIAVKRLLNLPEIPETNEAANTYWEALRWIAELAHIEVERE